MEIWAHYQTLSPLSDAVPQQMLEKFQDGGANDESDYISSEFSTDASHLLLQ